MFTKYLERKTADGQLLCFSCPEDSVEEVTAALAKIENLNLPTTHQVNVSHGGYGRYSRFVITQHNYAGGGHPGCGGFIETLEIANPPDERCPFIIHEFRDDYSHIGSTFWEFNSLKNLLAIWERAWGGGSHRHANIEKATGFQRRVECGGLTPWFYAIGDQSLFGDCAYPNHVGNDPIYRPWQKFVVYNRDGFPTIKTCMGCDRVTREVPKYDGSYYASSEKKEFRQVFWDDGTIYDEQHNAGCRLPRPLTEHDLFAQEAVDRLRECLSGQEKQFTINLSNNTRFTCRFHSGHRQDHTSAGVYFVRAIMGSGEEKEGTVEFEPTSEYPTLEAYLAKRGVQKVLQMKYQSTGVGTKKKKWAGVFPAPT